MLAIDLAVAALEDKGSGSAMAEIVVDDPRIDMAQHS